MSRKVPLLAALVVASLLGATETAGADGCSLSAELQNAAARVLDDVRSFQTLEFTGFASSDQKDRARLGRCFRILELRVDSINTSTSELVLLPTLTNARLEANEIASFAVMDPNAANQPVTFLEVIGDGQGGVHPRILGLTDALLVAYATLGTGRVTAADGTPLPIEGEAVLLRDPWLRASVLFFRSRGDQYILPLSVFPGSDLRKGVPVDYKSGFRKIIDIRSRLLLTSGTLSRESIHLLKKQRSELKLPGINFVRSKPVRSGPPLRPTTPRPRREPKR